MQKCTFYRADQLTEPHEVGVICVKKRNGLFNLTPVTSWNAFGKESTYITFALKNTSHSAYCIIARRSFTFSVPDVNIAKEVNLWGQNKGVYTKKLEIAPVEMEGFGKDFHAPAASCAVYCCKLRQHIEYGDHFLFVGEIVDVYADEKLKPLFSYDSRTALGATIRPKTVKNDLENTFKPKKATK